MTEAGATAALNELSDLLGPHRVSAHPADLSRHALDRSPGALLQRRSDRVAGVPICVVRPHTTKQVSEVLRWAHDTRTPVVPYGGGSGVVEGIASREAVVVELRAMNEIVDFDEKSRLVRVQGGVMGPDLDKALASWNFMLGHEPQSIRISTVGGWVATRASGQLSARYGGIEHLIAGLEAVLPGGRIARSKASPRSATGPDVASLMIGSEGTLGIVTEVTLRVSTLPDARFDRALRFEHMADGVAACRRIVHSGLKPTLVRLYDREDTALMLRNVPGAPHDPLLLLSFDGPEADRRAEVAVALSRGERDDESLVDHWWEHRNDATDEFMRVMAGDGILGAHAMVDTMEVSGTWSVLRELYHSMKAELGKRADLCGCHLSHVYPDGACLYFTMASVCESDESAAEVLEDWWSAGMEACLAAGGSISHHHGVGRRKARWLPDELGEWWNVLRAIKTTIDPHRIMNPGALGL